MYGATYGYFSSISPTMVSHLVGKVRGLVDFAKPKKGDVVLDIGCNDGTLLNAYGAEAGLTRIGMDPSARKFAHNYQPDIRVVYDFFSEKGARTLIGDKSCKIITSIAMFYDLEEPGDVVGKANSRRREFVCEQRQFAGNSPQGPFIEPPPFSECGVQ